jgi:lipopolysaccharide transport system ATP-binding protein
VSYGAVERLEDVVFGLAVHDLEGKLVFASNTEIMGTPLGTVEGPGEVVFATDHVPLLDGTYLLTIGVHSHDEGVVYDWHEQRHQFEVMNPTRTSGEVELGMRVSVTQASGEGAA